MDFFATCSVTFVQTGDPRVPYAANVDGSRWRVRVNELPEAPSAYTLLIDGRVALELMEWPTAWKKPD